jgi:uncharacterized protein YkwD
MKKMITLRKVYMKVTALLLTSVTALTFLTYINENNVHAATEIEDTYTDIYTDEYQGVMDEMVMLVNEAREDAGLKPVYEVRILNNAAYERAQETVDAFSHYRRDSSLFNTVLDEYNITYGAAAENLAAGSPTAEETFEQWKESPSHWKSIMNPNYTHIGVAMYYDENSTYGWYWTQLFIATDETMDGQYIPEKETVVPTCSGDIDGDGEVTTMDFTLLIQALRKNVILNDAQMESADCLVDDAVTIADAIVLKKYIIGMYDSLPRYL